MLTKDNGNVLACTFAAKGGWPAYSSQNCHDGKPEKSVTRGGEEKAMKFFCGLVIVASLGTTVYADQLVFDRGLPTANLNNAAGSSRSNVSWSDNQPNSNPTDYRLPGDDFSLAANATVDDIRVWVVGAGVENPGYLPSDLSLWGGNAGSAISQISTTYTSTQVTYADGSSYQGNNGGYWNIYQVDFAVNLNLAAGQMYDFFVDQPYECDLPGSPCPDYANAFLHASNAALSGSTQQGADNEFLWLDVNTTNGNQTVQTWDSNGNGWDKSSDANVQVYATPEASSILLLATGLLSAGAFVKLRRRRQS